MRLHVSIAFIAILPLLLTGCSEDRAVDPPTAESDDQSSLNADTERVAVEIIDAAGWEFDPEVDRPATADKSGSGLPCILDGERVLVTGDIYHYNWTIRIGTDPFDVIKLHRVVRERAPNRPIRARKSIFMLHGDYKTFDGCFMPGYLSPTNPDDFGAAVHAAANDIDVWGMDQAHNSITADETDFSSMADWDFYKYVDDTRGGMAIARVIRLFTGNGYRKMYLLGYSGGSALGFAVVNEEAGMPRGWRHVAGFIPVDQGMDSADPDFAANDCGTSQYYADLIAAGEYVEANPFPMFGIPARDDPDGPSELIPGFTNWQAAIAVAAYPYYEGWPLHFLAGEFDTDGLPAGLQYTDVDLWIDFMIEAPPFFANCFNRDEYYWGCGPEYAPWIDALGEVDLPVLYVASAGGFGPIYYSTLDLMTSADVTVLEISLHPPEEIELDFAHVDLFTATNAPELFWQPMMDWIAACRGAVDEDYPRVSVNAP